jgi:hypothetical protein
LSRQNSSSEPIVSATPYCQQVKGNDILSRKIAYDGHRDKLKRSDKSQKAFGCARLLIVPTYDEKTRKMSMMINIATNAQMA